jgi:hypothetical protein
VVFLISAIAIAASDRIMSGGKGHDQTGTSH